MSRLIIYLSVHHGNTKKIAELMAEVLGADLAEVGKANKKMVQDADLVGFGSGIYFGKHHKSLLNFLEKLPNCSGKKSFIFSTSGVGGTKQHWALKMALKSKGFEIIGEFACKAWDTFGLLKLTGGINKSRPNKKDLEKAREFAEEIDRKNL